MSIIPDLSGMCKRDYSQYNGHIGEAVRVISYTPMWETMKRKGFSTYQLIKDYGFSRGTLDSLKQNRNISTATLNDICNILSCNVEDVLQHIPDEK